MNEKQALRGQFQGLQSHVGCFAALEGLQPALAGRRVQGAPSTIFQVLEHMSYWQDITLARLRGERGEPPQSAREELLMIQGHNSYHLGQIVLLRQMLGSWPPPQGGSTW